MIDNEDQDKRVTQYLIPANVSARYEFIPGFGWYELKIVVLACIIGIVIFFGLGLFKKSVKMDPNNISVEMNFDVNQDNFKNYKKVPAIPTLLRAFAIIIPGVGAFFLVKKDPSNGMSLIHTLKSAKEFKKKQKLYLYKYGSGTEV